MTKLQTLGLTETTSTIQRKNGTRRFHDPITGCDYMSYDSGYIRRSYVTTSWMTGKPIRTLYQLNSTRKVNEFNTFYKRNIEFTRRILIHSEAERLERLAKSVANYRQTQQAETIRIDAINKKINILVFQDSVNQYLEGNINYEAALNEIEETLKECRLQNA